MKIRIFVVPGSRLCERAERFLKRHGIAFERVDVSAGEEAMDEMVKKSGQRGVPVFEIRRAHSIGIITGFDEMRLRSIIGLPVKRIKQERLAEWVPRDSRDVRLANAIYEERAERILEKLKTGKTVEINDAVKSIKELWRENVRENWEEREGNRATQTLKFLLEKFTEMCNDGKWEMRYAGLRGIGAMSISHVFDEKINEMISLFLRTIVDEDGRVRRASVNAFGSMRPMHEIVFTDDMYVDLFLTLQDMFDAEQDKKKKSSIDQALGKLYCPHLETCLMLRGYELVEEINLSLNSGFT